MELTTKQQELISEAIDKQRKYQIKNDLIAEKFSLAESKMEKLAGKAEHIRCKLGEVFDTLIDDLEAVGLTHEEAWNATLEYGVDSYISQSWLPSSYSC